MDDEADNPLQAEVVLARRIASAAPGLDGEAEAGLYRLLAPRVRRYGLRHLRDAEAAADLMQHVMLKIIEKLRAGALRDPEQIVSFVFGTCRLVVLDLRRGSLRRERLLEAYGEDLPFADIAPAPRVDHERVERCLETLSERERSVLVMTFHEDRDASDVAGQLGLTAGNVRVIRHRALERVRDCVTAGGGAS
jgi:RNA polymerase sigma-70 factor (ECF subfamily)